MLNGYRNFILVNTMRDRELKEKTISIITPTYNRAKLLINCHKSLMNQTNKNFEWIIVDDGSTDNTSDTVSDFINKSPDMKIIYVKKENGGKHTALNESHKYINGDYVLLLDSDDTLVDNAVDTVLKEWAKYDNDPSVGNVVFQRGRSTSQPNAYCKNSSTPIDFNKKKLVMIYSSDFCEICRAQLFIKYPFPVFENEKFLAEGLLWAKIGSEAKYVYVNEVIYIGDYLDGGLTKSGRLLRIRNSLGGMENANIFLSAEYSCKTRIKQALLYDTYGFFSYRKVSKILNAHKNNKTIKALLIIPAFMLYRYWKYRYNL